MDRRTVFAFVLMAVVIVLAQVLFPTHRATPTLSDSTSSASASSATAAPLPAAAGQSGATATAGATPVASGVTGALSAPGAAAAPSAARPPAAPAQMVTIGNASARYELTTAGAAPVAAVLSGYRTLRPGQHDSTVTVAQTMGPLLDYRLALGKDTIALDTVPFTVQRAGATTTFTSSAPAMSISYTENSNGYLVGVRGEVRGAPPGSALLVSLPGTFRSAEADSLDDFRHFAYGYKLSRHNVTSVPFSKLDSARARTDSGSMDWVAARTKYWLIALLADSSGARFHDLVMRGGSKVLRTVRNASAETALPLTSGGFAFNLYIGPQAWQQLHAIGNDLENVNPSGGFAHAIVQPLATIVMRLLLWMKSTTHLNYGWVVILFGIAIRVLLWPLYTSSMRTSIKMQRLQPELQEVQKKYKSDPEKQREALVTLYQSHGMSPLSPMLGCLPMLLPMPVLWALYYVFQNTIEFRGVPFLWLPDISLRDPTYIVPIVMGLSMFLMSWIGLRAAPSNPQTRMMSFMMPVMMTVIFLNFASGLNLYYAVQNIAALPQQWMIARERAKAGVGTRPAGGARKT